MLKSQKTLIASILSLTILILIAYLSYTFLQSYYTLSLKQSEKKLESINLNTLQIPYSLIQTYENDSQSIISIYNPSDKPLNLSTLYYTIEDENGKTICYKKLDPTKYSTTTGNEILYPKKQVTIIINTSECKLDPNKKYRICLVGNGKICSDLKYPSESSTPLPPITPISQPSQETSQQEVGYTIPPNAINITNCTVLDQDGGYYVLVNDIINSSTSTCINITANNITLDCIGHIIDGDDIADYGIYIYRPVQQTTNITIKNCIVQDWDTANIYFENANGNKIENVTSVSSTYYGIYLYYSSNNIIENSYIYNNDMDGIYLKYAFHNIIQTSNIYDNYAEGINLWNSFFNTVQNSNIHSNGDCGISLSNSSYTIVLNNNIIDDIWSDYSSYNDFQNNVIYNGGISLYNSYSNILKNNTFINGGLFVYQSYSNTVVNNTVNNKPLVYLENVSDYIVENAGQVIAINSWNITIRNSNISYTSIGIEFWNVSNSTIYGNKIYNSGYGYLFRYGIYFYESTYNVIINNTIYNHDHGIFIWQYSHNNSVINNIVYNNTQNGVYIGYSKYNTILNNSIYGNAYGIEIFRSSSNTIQNNTIYNNSKYGVLFSYSSSNILENNTIYRSGQYGIYLGLWSSNTIRNNKVYNNNIYGIYIYYSPNSLIYNNYFNNSANVGIVGTFQNSWNITKTPGINIIGGNYLGGNYWGAPDGSGFSDTCTDADNDDICDNSLFLATNNIDYLPLARP